MKLYAIQDTKTKCYYLFAFDEKDIENAKVKLAETEANKFFSVSGYDKSKIGEITDFEISVMDELQKKDGEQYMQLLDDDFCINTNPEACMQLLEKKLSAKPKPKPKPAADIQQTPPAKKHATEKKPTEEKIKCVCGANVNKSSVNKHEKTKTHIKNIGIDRNDVSSVVDVNE